MIEQVKRNYFYSVATEVPQGLSALDSNLIRVALTDSGTLQDGILWFQLSPGQTIASQIQQIAPLTLSCKLVVMSDQPNDLEALAAFAISAKAYCNTHAGVEVLSSIAGVVNQGGIWIGESIMQKLLNQQMPVVQIKQAVAEQWGSQLTGREKEVAVLVAKGLQNREIAESMKITERTVKAHVGAILDKLQLKSRLQLALLVKES